MALANDTKPLNHLKEHILELRSASAGNIFGDDHLTETLGCCGSRGVCCRRESGSGRGGAATGAAGAAGTARQLGGGGGAGEPER